MTTPAEYVAAARALKGARFRHRGRSATAVDCAGLVEVPAQRIGLPVPDYDRRYGREPWDGMLQKILRGWCGDPFPLAMASAGDIALIRWGQGQPSHLGVIGDHPYGGLSLIHADRLRGVVEQGLSGPLRACVLEVYRLPWGTHVH